MVYGATAETVADTVGIKVSEARPIVKGILKSFPDVTVWAEKQIRQAMEEGWVSTLSGRRRWFIGADEDPSLFTGPRNTPIQGSAADMLKESMVEIFDALRDEGYKSAQVLTVHDEIVVEVLDSEKEDVVPLIEQKMVEVGQEYLEGLPTPVDCTVAKEWRK
jgi:DNA polymerase-1